MLTKIKIHICPKNCFITTAGRKFCRNSQSQDFSQLDDYLHGRKNRERRDSVTKQILLERKLHRTRYEKIAVDSNFTIQLESIGIGLTKKKNLLSSRHNKHNTNSQNIPGAGLSCL
jgi:hypothetical protein